nr:hypothetical protein [uncultured Flavobacterium sp.]
MKRETNYSVIFYDIILLSHDELEWLRMSYVQEGKSKEAAIVREFQNHCSEIKNLFIS